MQVSFKWLQDYITFDWLPDELADRLTMIGTAVEKIEPLYKKFTGVIIGRIETVEPHPQKANLNVCTIDTGSGVKTVVCGAPNAHPGQYSPYALAGAKLPGDNEVSTVEIEGIASDGFLCSEAELGLSDDGDRLMVLDPDTAETGADLWTYLDLDDWILRFELTPNRPDCLSVIGVAREIGALTGSKLRRPEVTVAETDQSAVDRIRIELEDPQGCPRYAARIIEDIRIGPSPFWLKRRLISAGIRPINNIVDITNYVMIETGQPLHAFDFDTFGNPQIVVRAARAGEEFVTLDEEKRRLPESGVMITDGERAVAVGGVMGGLESEVSEKTRTVLLESAYFDAVRICRTRKILGLDTESALRFEKGVDPNGVDFALHRAAAMMASLAGGQVLRGAVDNYPEPIEGLRLELRANRVNSIIGMDLASPKMIDVLSSLEFGVSAGKTISVTVPTFRPDVTREIDLIEEIARVAGYEDIPTRRIAAGRIPTSVNEVGHFEYKLREMLVGHGLYEVVTNSLVDPKKLPAKEAARAVELKNPLSEDLSVMRPTLCGSLLGVVAHNFNRQIPSIRIFEIGRIFRKNDGRHSEQRSLAIMLAGDAVVTRWESPTRQHDFYDLKGVLASFLGQLGISMGVKPGKSNLMTSGASFFLQDDEVVLGFAGLIKPEIALQYEVKAPVWGAFLDFDKLQRAWRAESKYQAIPRFPKAERDCAVVVDRSVLAGDLAVAVREAGGELIESVNIFDVYMGQPIPADKKSVAINIAYRAADGTLTDQQVNTAQHKVVQALKMQYDAELRQ